MNILIRVDASTSMGTGHVMRCLTLALQFQKRGDRVTFACRDHKGNLNSIIKGKGFHLIELVSDKSENADLEIPDTSDNPVHYDWLGTSWRHDSREVIEKIRDHSIDWLLVDHYAIDERWEKELSKYVGQIMVIDDLADRKHACDLLLDQTYGRQIEDYQSLVGDKTTLLLGSRYTLLRPEFLLWQERSFLRRKIKAVRKILVSLGGGDPDNYTGKVLEALELCDLHRDTEIKVVLGSCAPWIDKVKTVAGSMSYNVDVMTDVSNMAELMYSADIAIGAAGGTTWERCYLGLPTILTIIADNQKIIAKKLSDIKAVTFLSEVNNNSLDLAIKDIKSNLAKRSLISRSLFSGYQECSITEAMEEDKSGFETVHFKPVELTHCKYLYDLQREPGTRRYFINTDIPKYEEHSAWFKAAYESSSRVLFIICRGVTDVGMLRLDNIDEERPEISIIVDPKYSGKGIANATIKEITRLNPRVSFKAVIHEENSASRRIFKKNGFVLVEKNSKFGTYYLNVCG